MKIVIDISEYDKEWIGNAYGIPQDINTKIAEAIINAEPCQPEPHWIPVTERLPETHEPVLVWSNGYICQDSIVCPWDDKIWYRGGKIEDGDYWMPLSELSEPYKGVTE